MQMTPSFFSPSSFWKFAMLWGTVWVLLVPPFQSPDEVNHFLRAWQVSEGKWLPEKTKDARLGGSLPASLSDFRDGFYYLKNRPDTCLTALQIFEKWQIYPTKNRTFFDFPNTAIYAPTAYLPQILAIFIGKIAHLPLLATFYLARFFNLMVWASIVATAIRLLPQGKIWMATLALLPASLAVAATTNADVLTNAFSFWVVAFALSNIHKQHAPLLFNNLIFNTLLIIIAINKVVFAPLALLVFLPKSELKIAQILPKIMLVAAVMLAAACQLKYANQLFISFDDYHPAHRTHLTLNEGVHPTQQLQWIFEHPFKFLGVVGKSFVEALPSVAAHVVGKFGWEKNYLPAWVIVGLWVAILLAIFSEKIMLLNRQRGLILFIIITCFSMFCISNFCLWHEVGSPVFHNFQGRYFVPLLPLLAAAAAGRYSKKKLPNLQKWIPVVVAALLFLGQFSMLFSVMERYFCR